MKWKNVLDLCTCLTIFPNRCKQNSQMAAKVPVLYSSFLLNVGRMCE